MFDILPLRVLSLDVLPLDVLPLHVTRLLLGFVLGAALGFVVRRGRFCVLGAIEDATYANDTRRLQSWLVAIGVAIAGLHVFELWGGIDLSRTIYLGARLDWGALMIGGLIFGFGMALNGTCGLGALRQLGGGDLKALLSFLVIGITAMMTMRGLTGHLRIAISEPLSWQLPAGFSQRLLEFAGLSGSGASIAAIVIGLVIAGLALANGGLRGHSRQTITGAAVGLLVALGWWATGIAGSDDFDTRRIESFTFIGPLGETLYYAMLSTALQPDFSVGTVPGVIFGAFIAARTNGSFKWDAPVNAADLKRRIFGAALMGFGGVTAMGCTIGQGVTGLSTLSIGSLLATLSIVLGARLGLYLRRGAKAASVATKRASCSEV